MSEKIEGAAITKQVRLGDMASNEGKGPNLFAGNMRLIEGLKVTLTVLVGGAEITVGELFSLKEASVVKLNVSLADPVEILLDGNVIARGELVAVDDNFGVKISEISGIS